MSKVKEIHVHHYKRSVNEDGNVIYTCTDLGCGYAVNFTHKRVMMELRNWWDRTKNGS